MSSGELVTAGDNSEFLFFQIIFVAALPQAEQSCAPTLISLKVLGSCHHRKEKQSHLGDLPLGGDE